MFEFFKGIKAIIYFFLGKNPEWLTCLHTTVSCLLGLPEDNDIIWVGSNQCMYLPEQIEKIKKNEDYKLGNGHIAGTFFIILSKKMYTHLYSFLSDGFESNMYPIDVLLDLSLKNEKMNATILYPKPVLPEIRDSDNMGPRSHIPFYNSRGLNNFEDFLSLELPPYFFKISF